MDEEEGTTGTLERGTIDNPYLGLPDPSTPFMFDAMSAHSLIGSTYLSRWFVLDEQSRAAFVNSTYLPLIYKASSTGLVEGFYLLAMLDPIVAGLLRDPARRERAVNFGTNKVRFTAPVRMHDVLAVKCTIQAVRRRPGGTVLELDCELRVSELDRPAMVVEWLIFYPD